MSTLLIELAGPQQAWGSRSRFATRATESAPTKSGVVGLVAAALGLERTASLKQFSGLRYGVRIDQPGRIERDFQTTRSRDGKTSYPLSNRYFVADAVFLTALEGERELLDEYRAALRAPRYPLFLGRRAFPPAGPIVTDLVDAPLETALAQHPWRARQHHRRRVRGDRVTLEVVRDAQPGETADATLADVPVSFDPRRRAFASRDVVRTSIDVGRPAPLKPRTPDASHGAETPKAGDRILGEATDHDPGLLLTDEEV
ncbi:type I-E CRISPR-associated protein Cas5/CasD [Microbacterium suaedae]|uniref:type I-E CRISPR-associated protein Cas5/CasD n=1 Tax=Microbacterium suaedae TaxID=2067813 RepID=UPI000DA20049|nr:type I-E CRISPR-associated protein Cas5/CasD [Microbacterium suaedae]